MQNTLGNTSDAYMLFLLFDSCTQFLYMTPIYKI